MKDERNSGWCYEDGDGGKHTNHSSSAAMVNETLNEIQLQAATTTTTMTIKPNHTKSVNVTECEKKYYRKVGQQRELL